MPRLTKDEELKALRTQVKDLTSLNNELKESAEYYRRLNGTQYLSNECNLKELAVANKNVQRLVTAFSMVRDSITHATIMLNTEGIAPKVQVDVKTSTTGQF